MPGAPFTRSDRDLNGAAAERNQQTLTVLLTHAILKNMYCNVPSRECSLAKLTSIEVNITCARKNRNHMYILFSLLITALEGEEHILPPPMAGLMHRLRCIGHPELSSWAFSERT